MGPVARGERLQIMLTAEELAAVDDFRFKHRLPARAAAVRELLQLGLASEKAGRGYRGRKSRDFGVLKASRTGRVDAGTE